MNTAVARRRDAHDEWGTPDDVFASLNRIFRFRLDPCAMPNNRLGTPEHFTREHDGLKQNWGYFGSVFVNPPYGNSCRRWIRHCAEQAANRPKLKIVMLIASRVDNAAWQDCVFPMASALLFRRRRISFLDGMQGLQPKESPNFGNALVCFNVPALMLEPLVPTWQLIDLVSAREGLAVSRWAQLLQDEQASMPAVLPKAG